MPSPITPFPLSVGVIGPDFSGTYSYLPSSFPLPQSHTFATKTRHQQNHVIYLHQGHCLDFNARKIYPFQLGPIEKHATIQCLFRQSGSLIDHFPNPFSNPVAAETTGPASLARVCNLVIRPRDPYPSSFANGFLPLLSHILQTGMGHRSPPPSFYLKSDTTTPVHMYFCIWYFHSITSDCTCSIESITCPSSAVVHP